MVYARPKSTAPDTTDRIPTASPADNRKEERRLAEGGVCLTLDRDGLEVVNGRLADLSTSGFRAVHTSRELTPGRVVRFHFEDRECRKQHSGWARVIWSRIETSSVETGFFVVLAD